MLKNKVLQLIQLAVELGELQEDSAYVNGELEKEVSYWKNAANELEQKLEATDKLCKYEANRRDELDTKLGETLQINENLRADIHAAAANYDKTYTELVEDLDKAHELLERANMEVDASRERIAELEQLVSANNTELEARNDMIAKLNDKLQRKHNCSKPVPIPVPIPVSIPEPAPEVEEVPVEPVEDVPEIKRDYYFRIMTNVEGYGVTTITEVTKDWYDRHSGSSNYFEYHESRTTARDHKFRDLLESYPPSAYKFGFISESDNLTYAALKLGS